MTFLHWNLISLSGYDINMSLKRKLNVIDHCTRLTANTLITDRGLALSSMFHGAFAAFDRPSPNINHTIMHK